MTEFSHEDAAVDLYHRVLRQEATDRAVAEAEQVVASAWTAELVRLREMARDGLADAKLSCQEAWAAVCAELGSAESSGLAAARARLAAAQDELRASIEAAQRVLGAIYRELAVVSTASEEREQHNRENRVRVWSAWCEAFEQGCQCEDEPPFGPEWKCDADLPDDTTGFTARDVPGPDVPGPHLPR
jgi:hypothetical protein